MTLFSNYILIISFVFSLSVGLFLTFKAIKLI